MIAEGRTNMEFSQTYLHNLQRFKDCINFKHIDRVLHFSNFYTWKILDSDMRPKLSEAMRDYRILERIQCEFQERYRFDCHFDLCTRNLIQPVEAMGAGYHIMIDDEKETINFIEHVLMDASEYEEYGTDRRSASWKMFNRKYPGLSKRQMLNAIIKNLEACAFAAHMTKKFIEVYNCPSVYNMNVAGAIQVPYERFYKYYRGIKEMAIDVRRHKDILIDTLNKIHEEDTKPALKKTLETLHAESSPFITDTMIAMLAHATLSQKQWDELYWPHLKDYLDMIVAAGKSTTIYLENSIIRFAEYFQDYPKGHIVIVVELDDLTKLRQKLPNVCLVGGMTSDLLGYGTPEQCVDRVKKLVNDLGDGFILGQDKMISFRNDCKRENLLAICDYVQNFRW